MAENINSIAIDFGSSNTEIAFFNPATNQSESFQLEGHQAASPSVVCMMPGSDSYITGSSVQSCLLAPNATVYRGFKMLLAEQEKKDGQLVPNAKARLESYDDTHTPSVITREFLKAKLNTIAGSVPVKNFQNTVVCVPEIWLRLHRHTTSRALLLEICKKLPMIDPAGVRLVTEPVAASAYLTDLYRRKYRKPYRGKIAIIDYGGGTLDLTLVDVSHDPVSNTITIDSLWRDGSGENHANGVGKAGLVYMEAVTDLALKAAGLDTTRNAQYTYFRMNLEREFMTRVNDVKNWVARNRRTPDQMATDEGIFVKFWHISTWVPVRWSMLCQAYRENIEPELIEYLKKLKDRLTQAKIDPRKNLDDFQFAIVGGFGQFPLVRSTIMNFFGISNEQDANIAHLTPRDANSAIAHGGALIAADVVRISNRSSISIGLFVTLNGKKTFFNAIRFHDVVKYDKRYKLKNDCGEWIPIYFGTSSKATQTSEWAIAYNDVDSVDEAFEMKLCEEKLTELQAHINPGRYFVSFSVNNSDLYSMHLFPVKGDQRADEENEQTIPLGNTIDMFGGNAAFPRDLLRRR